MEKDTSILSKSVVTPLARHAYSYKYLRLRLIALLAQLPVRFLLILSFYLRDPKYLRKFDVSRLKVNIPSRQQGRNIKAYIYTPNNYSKRPSPVHLNWHGSGYILPAHGSDTETCCYLARQLGCVVLDCSYRMAPKWPFPAAVQDVEDACLYVLAHPELYDTSKVSVGGASAGANLALAVAAKLGPEKIQAVCSIAPPTDFRPSARPKKAPLANHRAALPPRVSLFFDACYLVINSDRSDPLLSPICAESKNFPKSVYIATGTGDTLYNDGKRLIDKLKADGHPNAMFRSCDRVGHGFEKFQFKSDGPDNWAKIVLEDIVSVIRSSWSQNNSRVNGAAKM